MRPRPSVDLQPPKGDFTPMIDVVFLLLVFFLCATRFRQDEGMLKALLPKDRGRDGVTTSTPEPVRLRLRRGAEGRVSLRLGALELEQVAHYPDPEHYRNVQTEPTPDYAELERRLQALREIGGALPPAVIIDAEPRVPYRHVVRALNACAAAGLKDVAFAQNER